MEKLTLPGLAEKLEMLTEKVSGLEQENERIRTENTGLRERVAELTRKANDSVADVLTPDSPSIFEGAMSRRTLFSKAGAAAVAATAAGMLLTPREAQAKETFLQGVQVLTKNGGGSVNHAFLGFPSAAVEGNHYKKHGVLGRTRDSNYQGVRGVAEGKSGTGVRGIGKGALSSGVRGTNTDKDGRGVSGFGEFGVQGDSNRTNGVGVFGASAAQSGGRGVFGYAEFGYGGQFLGGRAHLYLQPVARVGSPTSGSHRKGEIVMDSNASIWVCISSGTPGSWNLVSTYQPGGG